MLSVPHLDREFDYLVSAEQSDDAHPGVRVRVRFTVGWSTRLSSKDVQTQTMWESSAGWTGSYRLSRCSRPTCAGSPTPSPPAMRAPGPTSCGWLSRRGTPTSRSRLGQSSDPSPEPVHTPAWEAYRGGAQYVAALSDGRAARAVWQALPGERWAARLAERPRSTANAGRGALAIVPDQRDVDAVHAAAVRLFDESRVVALSAGLGPAQRYRRWLSVLRGDARHRRGDPQRRVRPRGESRPGDGVGRRRRHAVRATRSVPTRQGGGDAARPSVALCVAHRRLCAHRRGAGAGPQRLGARSGGRPAGGARTVTAGRRHRGQWIRARTRPRGTDRPPAVDGAAGRPHGAGGRRPVLVQVPRRGYVPALACGRCRTIARCRHCTGPLSLPARDTAGAVCRWCGRAEPALRCTRCGSDAVRAVVVGARRTAEELGRTFPGVTVVTSGGDAMVAAVPGEPALVVSTPGAEPVAAGGTAPPCSWTPGRYSGVRTSGRPRTHCAGGWRPPRSSAAAATVDWSR